MPTIVVLLLVLLGASLLGGVAVMAAQSSTKPRELPASPQRMGMRSITTDGNALALAEVEERRRRRAAARALVAEDPAAARELGIGRPDLRRHYDDGGLVDLNSAPHAVLVEVLGIDATQAEAILEARARMGRLESPDDLHLVDAIDPVTFDRILDRVVLL